MQHHIQIYITPPQVCNPGYLSFGKMLYYSYNCIQYIVVYS